MVGREGPSGLSDHPIRFLNQSFTSLADYCDARHLFDRKRKGPALRRGLSGYDTRGPRLDQKSMPPMPPMPGAAGSSFFGSSATMASVVIIRPAMEAAFCSAVRVTLVGSRMPNSTMSPNWPLAAL